VRVKSLSVAPAAPTFATSAASAPQPIAAAAAPTASPPAAAAHTPQPPVAPTPTAAPVPAATEVHPTVAASHELPPPPASPSTQHSASFMSPDSPTAATVSALTAALFPPANDENHAPNQATNGTLSRQNPADQLPISSAGGEATSKLNKADLLLFSPVKRNDTSTAAASAASAASAAVPQLQPDYLTRTPLHPSSNHALSVTGPRTALFPQADLPTRATSSSHSANSSVLFPSSTPTSRNSHSALSTSAISRPSAVEAALRGERSLQESYKRMLSQLFADA
jgi:hypothetical protein